MTSAPTAYLDHNATTRPLDAVTRVVVEAHESLWANASSTHRAGQAVRQRIELARQQVARLLNAAPRDLIFTSGGTEANNLALRGLLLPLLRPDAPRRPVLLTTAVEHSAVREPADLFAKHGVPVHRLPLDSAGRVTPVALADALAEHAAADTLVLASIIWANNETGVLHDIAALRDAIRTHTQASPTARVLLHTDATQAVGKTPVDVADTGVDLLTCAAHKFHGPKGVGVLYARRGVRLQPQNLGGSQELDRRGGTENTPAILGMGVAAEAADAFLADAPAVATQRAKRDRLERELLAAIPGSVVNAGHADRLWNTSSFACPGLEAEAILLGLSEQGVSASAGSACSSGSLDPSPVLVAMGLPDPVAHGSLRLSLSRFTTDAEVDHAIDALPRVVQRLARVLPT